MVSLFVQQKLQDGRTNLNQTFSGDSDYPRRKFRPKRFRLQPKRSENKGPTCKVHLYFFIKSTPGYI